MSSEGPNSGPTLALARQRHERRDEDSAEIIDLVRLPRGTRPTPIASVGFEEVERLRVLDCDHYQSCLAFVAQVRWRSFHCRQCPKSPERQQQAAPASEAPAAPAHAAKIIELP